MQALKKQYKSGKPSKEDKAAQREEKKQADKDDKVVRALATKGRRLLDTMVSKFDAYSMKLKKVEGLDYDWVQAFETSKGPSLRGTPSARPPWER